jgi:hypothetical protein
MVSSQLRLHITGHHMSKLTTGALRMVNSALRSPAEQDALASAYGR